MWLQKKFILSIVMLFSGFMPGLWASQGVAMQDQALHSFEIGRMQAPTIFEIELQKKLQSSRMIRRYAVTAGVSLSVFAILCLASSVRHSLEEQKKLNMVSYRVPEPWSFMKTVKGLSYLGTDTLSTVATKEEPSSNLLWPVTAVAGGIKNMGASVAGFGKDFTKFLADSTTLLAAGVVTSAVYEYLRNKVAQVYQDETLLWFVDQQTKIHVILTDLKQRTAEYDLHGALLSHEMLSQNTQVHLKAFITEISEAASDYKHDNVMRDYDYFAYLLGEVKKKYVQKADQLEQIQDQLVPLIAHRHRVLANLEGANLFDRDAQCRADIAELSRQLLFEMRKLVAFIEMHKHKHQARVKDLIASLNRFLEHVETMLKSSQEQVEAMSKQNRGIFTVTYEYERLFDQQIQFLDKYCKIVVS